ncbi:Signal transduction histidine-protein kinase BarA [Thalassoglobus neptunius]|uniref:histidine kinase n=1 Tax=Thalassoglobus neptunius TaxID=1938619 RepID=A0A5C5X8B4_9PLAN|nr:ATP-binding protein [Thalassoglobus neptunius]TWT58533.1 Signal transduction histidine-protein kinase BarA [Thalassoglobus neptunius]
MSYRRFKKLLGETSLERKCRLMFAGALLLLIGASFWVYARLNQRVVEEQQRDLAKLLIAQNLTVTHWEKTQSLIDPETIDIVADLSRTLKPDDLAEEKWRFIPQDYENSDATRRPTETYDHDALKKLLYGGEKYWVYVDSEEQSYHYYEPIIAKENCLLCHRDRQFEPQISELDEMMGMARITFDLKKTQHDIDRNNAILTVMAIVTAVLGMGIAYLIVRYVIVKPVMHLKDVSDAIAQGELDQRADIQTGDEFQELSHAFNRMLRHLVSTQEELRQTNVSMDHKVDELAQANLRLHDMNQIKNEFLATMSHELRTPLNSILGFSDVLTVSDNLTEKQKKYLRNIQSSGKNLLVLINDILDLAKMDAGRMEVHSVEFSMVDLVERQVLSMKPLAEKKNIDLSWEIDENFPILNQDAGKIEQILSNLLSNAVKFTPEGGRIRVDVSIFDEDLFDLVVADSGVGIPLEDQSIIFEKFRQGRSQVGSDLTTREFEGTGLGLSIVKELCRLLGGQVLLESEFGKGSTFTVRLPLNFVCLNPQVPSNGMISLHQPGSYSPAVGRTRAT